MTTLFSRHLTPAQRETIAEEVRAARARGTPWKALAIRFARTERQLRRYVRPQQRPDICQMSDLARCADAAASI
jgi:hypothetical protein